jgi:predicted GNAT family N-acyltransferase
LPVPEMVGKKKIGFTYELLEEENIKDALKISREVFVEEQGIPVKLVEEGKDTSLYLLVKEGERAVGTARIRFLSPSLAKLERMAVLKSFRNQGIGRGIVSFFDSELKGRGVKKLTLNAQHQVFAFYSKCGFKEVGQPFQEVGIDHVKMEKQL